VSRYSAGIHQTVAVIFGLDPLRSLEDRGVVITTANRICLIARRRPGMTGLPPRSWDQR
jgi:hypothetical protein